MRTWSYFLLISVFFVAGCKPDHSSHEMVDIRNTNREFDDIYITYLKDQIDSDPEVVDNYIKLANIYYEQSQGSKAISLLQNASNETSDDGRILLELGKLYLEHGDVENLSKVLRHIRQTDPDNIVFLKLSAGYSILLKDYTNAMFFANRAMLINPYDDENLLLLASAKLINKDSITAYQNLEEAYNLNSSVKNFSQLFDLSLALNQTEKAKTLLEDYERSNKNQNTCYLWGAYYNRTGLKDSARYNLVHCSNDGLSNDRVLLEMAKTYYPINIDSVFHFVDLYIEMHPDDINALVFKAKTLERIGFYNEASNLYQSAIKIDSTSTLAINELSNLERKVAYLRLKRRQENVQKDLETLKPLNSREIN